MITRIKNLARCYDGQDEQEFQNCMRNMYNVKKEFNSREVEDIAENI
jgi:hypothetical protein